jgi:hypothetical protein
VKPLKEVAGAEDANTAALEHLDLVVQSLDEVTALAVEEVVGEREFDVSMGKLPRIWWHTRQLKASA